ncbi:MAG: hypothetical protein KC414_13150, partial [Romboutsia sp.]|nr:hypothetical protein [Romboutsia sp.]
KAEGYLSDNQLKGKWEEKRQQLVKDKIDVSSFLTWFLMHYPKSHQVMRDTPEYQNRFKLENEMYN